MVRRFLERVIKTFYLSHRVDCARQRCEDAVFLDQIVGAGILGLLCAFIVFAYRQGMKVVPGDWSIFDSYWP